MLIGCSGWSYADSFESGGWLKVFYPDAKTKKLQYYSQFFNTEEFLDRLPSGYDYAIEFRNPSWNTEGPWEMLKHYNIAAVMSDSPEQDNLQFLSQAIVTANHCFIRWHGRQVKPRYNYLYSREELKLWVDKVRQLSNETAVVRGYFNNHYGA